jgi:hypothetical protein
MILAIIFETLSPYILYWWGYYYTHTEEAVLLIRLFIPGHWLLLIATNYMVFSTEHDHPGHETVANVIGIVVHVASLILLCLMGNM